MKKFTILILSLIILLTTTCFAAEFSDLSKEHWSYNNIMTLVEKGVINGYTDGTYKPENKVTRGEFFKLISLATVEQEEIDYYDPGLEGWATPYWCWLYLKGFLMESNKNDVNLDAPITREEMANVLSKIARGYKIEDTFVDPNKPSKVTTYFIDTDDLSVNSRININHASSLGVINGYEDGSFKPQKEMTRAEVAAVIYRFSSIRGGV